MKHNLTDEKTGPRLLWGALVTAGLIAAGAWLALDGGAGSSQTTARAGRSEQPNAQQERAANETAPADEVSAPVQTPQQQADTARAQLRMDPAEAARQREMLTRRLRGEELTLQGLTASLEQIEAAQARAANAELEQRRTMLQQKHERQARRVLEIEQKIKDLNQAG